MDILVIGSGGREHTLVWKLRKSPQIEKIYCAPGNGGISEIAECVDIQVEDVRSLLQFAKDKKVGLTVVGPEAPLVIGIVDAFEREGLKIFGPNRYAAQLEGSKAFAKFFMKEFGIPTAEFEIFENLEQAKLYLNRINFPVVIKADGLAAGKGVVICQTKSDAETALHQMMSEKIFKDAGSRVVIEECLIGEEVSLLSICDGEHFIMLDSAQDHKRAFDHDKGPNTGGMGAYSPAPVCTDALKKQVAEQVIAPTLSGMKKRGHLFKGVLYAGIMVTSKGPSVLEFNARFGDPETQAVLPRMKNDLAEVMLASCNGTLNSIDLKYDNRPCVCVVMASGGYPDSYEKDKEIFGLEKFVNTEDVMVFHAGTKKQGSKILTTGGRVLGVTAFGNDVTQAIDKVYEAVREISFDKCFFRRDIGFRAIKRI